MLEITIRPIQTIAVLDLSGDVDIDAAVFIERIGWCLENGYLDILCNFENVRSVDYAGLSVLTIAYKNVINHHGRMKFIGVDAPAKRLLSLMYLDTVFEIYEDPQDALKSFEQDRIIEEIQKKQLRRRFKRLPSALDTEFKSSKEKEFHPGKILNISAVGILVFSKKIYPVGEILTLRLPLLPRSGILEVRAKVVWLIEKELQPQIYPGMALEFYRLENTVQKEIIAFIEKNLASGNPV